MHIDPRFKPQNNEDILHLECTQLATPCCFYATIASRSAKYLTTMIYIYIRIYCHFTCDVACHMYVRTYILIVSFAYC